MYNRNIYLKNIVGNINKKFEEFEYIINDKEKIIEDRDKILKVRQKELE